MWLAFSVVKILISFLSIIPDFMSPYEFMSKTHSLSTEDLGKFFID